MKNNLNLTLSHIIHNQSEEILMKILELQNYLIGEVDSSKQISDNTIYQYPRKTIHHSLINFLSPKESIINDSEIDIYKNKNWGLILSIVSKLENKKIRDKKVIIKSVYTDDKNIALEAFPSEDILNFIYRFAKEIKKESNFTYVKGFPPEKPIKFPINIVHFFRPLSEQEKQTFNKKKEEINRKLMEEPLEFELKKFSLVISDDYLSNPNPEIANFYV